MENIKLQYNDIEIKKQDVNSQILEILNIIEKIDSNIKTLRGSWGGKLSDAFLETTERLLKCSNTVASNIRVTNEFKEIVTNEFISMEQENISKYGD